jgi:hypothetical protein
MPITFSSLVFRMPISRQDDLALYDLTLSRKSISICSLLSILSDKSGWILRIKLCVASLAVFDA